MEFLCQRRKSRSSSRKVRLKRGLQSMRNSSISCWASMMRKNDNNSCQLQYKIQQVISQMSRPQQKSDFERLVQLCNSYGLNEQQTKQIISDFQNGSFNYGQGQSIDDSFHQSIKEMVSDREEIHESSYESARPCPEAKSKLMQISGREEECSEDYAQFSRRERSEKIQEEYSFKNYHQNQSSEFCFNSNPRYGLKSGNNTNRNKNNQQKNYDSLEDQFSKGTINRERNQKYSKIHSSNQRPLENNQLNSRNSGSFQKNAHQQSTAISTQIIQSMLTPLLQNFQIYYRDISQHLSYNNQILGRQVEDKQQQIQMLTKIKLQDAEIICSLKDSISNLTNQLNYKDKNYQQLMQKYSQQEKQMKSLKSKLQEAENQLSSLQYRPQSQSVSQYQSNHSNSQYNGTFQMEEDCNENNKNHFKKSSNQENNVNFMNQNFMPPARNYSKSRISETKRVNEKANAPEQERGRSPIAKKNIVSQKQLQPQSSNQNLQKARSQSILNCNSGAQKRKAFEDRNYGKYLQNNSKRTGVDINKYKGMIQKLRGSYEIR